MDLVRRIALLSFSFSLVSLGCASTVRSGDIKRACGRGSQTLDDVLKFGFMPHKGRIQVFRLFASWCPYCKDDLKEIGKRFASGEWKSSDVNVLLLAYRNRNEDQASYNEFVKDFSRFGIPEEAAQIVYIDQDFAALSKTVGADGKPLFVGWRGVPFALLFGKDGRLVFRGHFTDSPPMQDVHYKLVTELSKESCK